MAILAAEINQSKTGLGRTMEAPKFESIVSFLLAEQPAGETFHPQQKGLEYERLGVKHRGSCGLPGIEDYFIFSFEPSKVVTCAYIKPSLVT